MSYGVDHKLGLDPALLWLWCRPAATVLIQPLAWELSYATGAALKKKKKVYSLLLFNSFMQSKERKTDKKIPRPNDKWM